VLPGPDVRRVQPRECHQWPHPFAATPLGRGTSRL